MNGYLILRMIDVTMENLSIVAEIAKDVAIARSEADVIEGFDVLVEFRLHEFK